MRLIKAIRLASAFAGGGRFYRTTFSAILYAMGVSAVALLASGCSTTGAARPTGAPPPAPAFLPISLARSPYALAVAANGAVWFSEYQNNVIGRLDPDGKVRFFKLDTNGFPVRLAVDRTGSLWFTDAAANRIGRLSPDGRVHYFPVPTDHAGPAGITLGPDGNIWFTEHAAGKIARMTPKGSFIEYSLPNGGGPAEIISGPDNSLWFVEDAASRIGEITLYGKIQEFPLPTPDSHPGAIAVTPQGKVWVTELATGRVAMIDEKKHPVDFPLPVRGAPLGIAAGQDSTVWITIARAHTICKVAPDNTIEAYHTSRDVIPGFIVAAPDNTFWFSEPNGKLAHLTPPLSIREFNVVAPRHRAAIASASPG